MSSKEALDELYTFASSSEPMEIVIKDFYNVIEKDLEVLEILKNKLEIKSLDIGIEDIFLKGTNYIVMFEEEEEDFNKVKEWLEK